LSSGLEPGVTKALEAKAKEAELMTTKNPEFTVYANITADLDYKWDDEPGIAPRTTDKWLSDAHFVGLELSYVKVSKEQEIVEDEYLGFSRHLKTNRVTYSVPVDFGETLEQKRRRMFMKQAGDAVHSGMSARAFAEHSHRDIDMGWTREDEREEERREKWGEVSLRTEREDELRKLWVKAYIEYTASYGPQDQYIDAVRYLEELEARHRPATYQLPPVDVKAFEKFLRTK
jgi:hypothetical protein